MNQFDKMWRTQVEVAAINSGYFWLRIMGRDPDELTGILTENFPYPDVEVGKILHVRTNTGARHSSDLRFSDWEYQ